MVTSMRSESKNLDLIQKALTRNFETVGVAESVTAGNLQAAFSLAKNATDFFQGGLTLYNMGQKARHLLVDPIQAERTNCVSDKIAGSMAIGACKFFSSTWGIGITGYAAPVPAWGVRSTLFSWCSIARNETVVFTKKIEVKKMTMEKVQYYYVRTILDEFANILKS